MIYDNTPDFYRQQDELARQYARQRQAHFDRMLEDWARTDPAPVQQDMFADQQPNHTGGNP